MLVGASGERQELFHFPLLVQEQVSWEVPCILQVTWSPLVCKQGDREVIYLISILLVQELVSSRRVLLCTVELISLVST